MTEGDLIGLIRRSEADTLDFKAQQYAFFGTSEREKSGVTQGYSRPC
jgi:hypothetical protein